MSWELEYDGNKLKLFIPWYEICIANKKRYFAFKHNNKHYNILLPKEPLPPYFAIAQLYRIQKNTLRYKVIKTSSEIFDFYEIKVAFITDTIPSYSYIKPNNKNFIVNIPKRLLGITTDDKTWVLLSTKKQYNINCFVKFALVRKRIKETKLFSGYIIEKLNFDDGLKEIEKHMEVKEFFKNIGKKKFKRGVQI